MKNMFDRNKRISFKKLFHTIILLLVAFVIVGCKKDEVEDVVYQLDTRYTDQLTLTIPVEGKSFLVDGIGEFKLNKVIDGDTITVFGLEESVRFLGIDAPESTSRIEPWGVDATNFVKEKLENTESLVLQSEGELTDNYGRYLAWVWYLPVNSARYRLLNLELIEHALTKFTLGETMYYDILLAAHEKTELTDEGVFGYRNDPNFNYSRNPVETTVAEALANHDSYKVGTKFLFKVQVVRIVSESLFVSDAETDPVLGKKGHIYVYTGPGANYSNHIKPGDIITLEAQLQYEGQFGTQLTGVKNVGLHSDGNKELDILEVDANTIAKIPTDEHKAKVDMEQYYGQVIKLSNITLKETRRSANDIKKNYFNLIFVNGNNVEISVRVAPDKSQYDYDDFKDAIGKKFTVIGGVSSYDVLDQYYQIMIGERNHTEIPDLLIIN